MALGRGLGALITSTGKSSSAPIKDQGHTEGQVWYIPITKITPNPNQPRKHFVPEELQELAESIKQYGVLQPLIVSEKKDGGYELVAGERRLRASQIAGVPTVPAIIKQLPEKSKLEIALIENIQRSNLDPIEEAFAFKRLIDEFGLSQQEVADKMSKSRSAVANAVRLLDLPLSAQTALIEGKINSGQARTILSLEGEDERLNLLSSLLGQKISVRELERDVTQKKISKGSGLTRRDPNLLYLENKLREKLGTKVVITKKGESGTIVLSYYSNEELSGLVDKLTE
jgi:ParB family chromosome partitioning protein